MAEQSGRKFTLERDYYDTGDNLFKNKTVTIKPGVTVLVGCNGTGKTTQIRLLAEYLKQKGESVFTDVEPSGLPTGRFLRQLLAGEFPSSPWATAALFLSEGVLFHGAPVSRQLFQMK